MGPIHCPKMLQSGLGLGFRLNDLSYSSGALMSAESYLLDVKASCRSMDSLNKLTSRL